MYLDFGKNEIKKNQESSSEFLLLRSTAHPQAWGEVSGARHNERMYPFSASVSQQGVCSRYLNVKRGWVVGGCDGRRAKLITRGALWRISM